MPKVYKLTAKELHMVWNFATETPGHNINYQWLINMVEEIRTHRNVLEEISKDFHSCDCLEIDGFGCLCHVGLAKKALGIE